MRNLKKVLTLVLTVAMVLSIMVVGTGAAFSDQDQIKNKEAVDVCTTLNIIAGMEDGSYRPANNVTRAQMCKMICVALNGGKEPTLGTNATPTFSDVRTDPSSSWAESFIESCNSQGIVSGVGGGRFSPSGSVTGTQAARMLLVALGYRADIQKFTGDAWAINVNTLASAKGLYAGIESIDANAALSRDNAAQMIWNALNAYEVEYVSQLTTVNGQLTSELVAQDKVVGSNRDKITMLEDKYEADTAIGTFAGNHDTNGAIKDGNIRITNATVNGSTVTVNGINYPQFDFKYDFDLKYIGEEVKVLYRDSQDGVNGRLDDKDTIYGVYVTGATTVYNITKDDIQEVTNGTQPQIKFNDTKYDFVTGVDSSSANNGNIYTNYVTSNPDQMNYTNMNALKVQSVDSIKFICNADGKIATAYVTTYNAGRVTGVSSNKVTISGLGSIDIEGNDIYSGIAKDDVAVYTRFFNSSDNEKAFFTVTKADAVEGELTGFKSGVDNVVVANTTYSVEDRTLLNLTDDSIQNSDFADSSKIGDTVRVFLMNGMAVALQSIESSGGNYAVVTDADTSGSITSTLTGWKISVMLPDGTEQTYPVHKDSASVVEAPSVDGDTNGKDLIAGKLIEYSISGDKIKITSIEKASTITGTSGGNERVWDKTQKTLTYGTTNTAVAASDAVLFVKVGSDFYAYSLRSLSNIANTAGGVPVAKILNDDNLVKAAYIELGSKPGSATSDTVYGIVTDYVGTRKVDNTTYYRYTIAAGTTPEIEVNVDDGTALDKGDLVKFDRTSDDLYTKDSFTKALDKSVTTADPTGTGWTLAAVSAYQNNTLVYYTGTTWNSTDSEFKGSGSKQTITVADDVKKIYINFSKDEAGIDSDVGVFDVSTGYANIVFHVNDDGIVDVIFVETSGDANLDTRTSSNSPSFGTGKPATP